MDIHLITETGDRILPGRMVLAHTGPHQGTWWRLEGVFHNGTEHMVKASRHTRVGRMRHVFHPSAFSLSVREVFSRKRRAVNRVHHTWQRFDEWLLAGVVALVPLAFFEHYHWAESITSATTSLFGGGGH